MNRMHKAALALSLVLVAFVTSGYVIKDTANPVDIYTGSNTTPTISGATSGSVTLGPSSATGIGHIVNGQTIRLDSDNSNARIQFYTGGVAKWTVEKDNVSYGTDGLTFTASTTPMGGITSAGAWTIGPSGFGGAHPINGALSLNGGDTLSVYDEITGSATAVVFSGTGSISSGTPTITYYFRRIGKLVVYIVGLDGTYNLAADVKALGIAFPSGFAPTNTSTGAGRFHLATTSYYQVFTQATGIGFQRFDQAFLAADLGNSITTGYVSGAYVIE